MVSENKLAEVAVLFLTFGDIISPQDRDRILKNLVKILPEDWERYTGRELGMFLAHYYITNHQKDLHPLYFLDNEGNINILCFNGVDSFTWVDKNNMSIYNITRNIFSLLPVKRSVLISLKILELKEEMCNILFKYDLIEDRERVIRRSPSPRFTRPLKRKIKDQEARKHRIDIIEELLSMKNKKGEWSDLSKNLYNETHLVSYLYPEIVCPYNFKFIMTESIKSNGKLPEIQISGSIKVNIPGVLRCIYKGEKNGQNVAFELSVRKIKGGGHANMIWIDTRNKEIEIYDPSKSGETDLLKNQTFARWFKKYLPDYTFLGNITPIEYCIQYVRRDKRSGKRDSFCIDYSSLYLIRRIQGDTREQANQYMISLLDNKEKLFSAIRSFYHQVEDVINPE